MRIFLVIFFLFSTSVLGQKKSEKQNLSPFTTGEKFHILGLNAILSPSFFFDRPETLPMELIYRRFNGNNQAFRVRLEGRYDKSLEENLPFFEEKWNSSVGAAAGYEWHQPISPRWSWYYGGELGGAYYWVDEDFARPTLFAEIPMVFYRFREERITEKSIQGFFGVFFNLNSKVLLTIHQGANFSFMKNISEGLGDLVPLDPQIEDVYGSSGGGNANYFYRRVFITSKVGVHFKF